MTLIAHTWNFTILACIETGIHHVWARKLKYIRQIITQPWKCDKSGISAFILKKCFLASKVFLWCQRMSTYLNGPWIRVKLDIFMFPWKMFFWPRKCSFDPAQTNRQIHFKFFSYTLPSVEGTFLHRMLFHRHRTQKPTKEPSFRVDRPILMFSWEIFLWPLGDLFSKLKNLKELVFSLRKAFFDIRSRKSNF